MEQRPILFPKDEQKHNSKTEWWYFNGHLSASAGNKYSYMSTLFKVRYPRVLGGVFEYLPSKDVYFYHSTITDITNKKFLPNIEYKFKVNDNSTDLLDLNFFSKANDKNYFIFQKDKDDYELCGRNLELTMKNKKPPLLVGGEGFVDNVGEETFYYSLTDLTTKGRLYLNNIGVDVKGTSWMDHQWGEFGIPSGFWNWFCIQLTGDIQLVCYQVGNDSSSHTLATISFGDGSQKTYKNIEIQAGKEAWTSQTSGASYPLKWHINIPDAKIIIETRSVVQDHEINFWYVNYWEGPIEVKAKIKDKVHHGQGYQELVGRKSNIKRRGDFTSFVKTVPRLLLHK